MKPIVGILPLWNNEKKRLWMRPDYTDSILEAGGIPVVFPMTEDREDLKRLLGLCDGILFPGGQDVSPEVYGEAPVPELGECCEMRDRMEAIVLEEALKADKPVLGICRGMQFINAALGGTLYQDLPSQRPSDIRHDQAEASDVMTHTVAIPEDSPLYECLQTALLPVNSFHHQAVKTLAPGLECMAVSPDGLVEAYHKPDCRFLWAVQWHPEMMHEQDPFSRKLFRTFVEKMQ